MINRSRQSSSRKAAAKSAGSLNTDVTLAGIPFHHDGEEPTPLSQRAIIEPSFVRGDRSWLFNFDRNEVAVREMLSVLTLRR